MTDPIQDFEYDAYLDGELPLTRRLAIEDQLSRDPVAAARMMGDLGTRTALTLLHAPRDAPAASVAGLAGRLARRLERGRAGWWMPLAGRSAAAAVIVAAIGLAVAPQRQASAAPPSYVTEALMSYRTGLLRAAMVSQIESRDFDRAEIQNRTRIHVPRLPDGWRITDVQLFPSDDGPALQIMVRTPLDRDVSIFAVRARSAAPFNPVAVRQGGRSIAYWQRNDISYAMIGSEAPAALDLAATDLAARSTD